jgi:chemotaxis protein CheD
VAEARVSDDTETTLVTYALGSCIALLIYDPVARVAGMLHFLLPDSAIDPVKARSKPCMFADTGVRQLLDDACARGAEKRRLVVRVVGGAQVADEPDVFHIGKRNYQALSRILSNVDLLVDAEDVGGNVSRTVRLEVGTGRCWVRNGAAEYEFRHARNVN